MNLPPLSSSDQIKSQFLMDRLIHCIEENGSMGFDQFLNTVLYDPEHGYYCHKNEIFGAEGDFITAPTRSDLFSMTIAKQCMQILGNTRQTSIVELGPGNGELAKTILQYLQHHSALPESYYLIETSSTLKARQKKIISECIPEALSIVHWIEAEQLPEFSGVVIANEMLDAIPFKRIQVVNNQFYEVCVGYEGKAFVWETLELEQKIKQYIEQFIPGDILERDNFQTEVHLAYEPLLIKLSQKLSQGVFLVMDYGSVKQDYYSADKNKGSMRCFYQHRVHDNPFMNIGFQDITSDVEFSALAYIAFHNSYDILGYTTQANFLIGNDVQSIYHETINTSHVDNINLSYELKSLVMPDEMGERFKVLALGKNYNQPLDGFSFKDLTYSL